MNDQQLMRYSRHILLNEIGIEGQAKMLSSRALIVGVGGLGSPAALYLASSGVGRITLCDPDVVDFSNLQRQIIHRTRAVGRLKVESAKETLEDVNPEIKYVTLAERVDDERLLELVADADVVLDCSDNFATRYAVNRACVAKRTPLVSGAAIMMHGQLSVFDFRRPDAPCYNCLFSEESEAPELRCATTGVFAPLVGIIGAMQAAEAIKLLAGIERGLSNRLFFVNALDMNVMISDVSKDASCKVCGAHPSLVDRARSPAESCSVKSSSCLVVGKE